MERNVDPVIVESLETNVTTSTKRLCKMREQTRCIDQYTCGFPLGEFAWRCRGV